MNVDVAKANSAHISCDVLCHTVHTHAHTFAIHPFAPIIFWMNSKNRSKKVQMITYPQNDEIRCAQRVKKEQQRYNTHSDKAMQSAKRKMIYMNIYLNCMKVRGDGIFFILFFRMECMKSNFHKHLVDARECV